MQFRVPQNIAMEDRIFGPLTAIQFGILVLGGGASFLVWTSSSIPKPLNTILGGLSAVLTITLSLGKFNDQPMYRFFRYIIAFIVTPKTRVWHKTGVEPVLIKRTEQKVAASHVHAAKHLSKNDLARLAAVIDSRGQEGTIPTSALEPKKPDQS